MKNIKALGILVIMFSFVALDVQLAPLASAQNIDVTPSPAFSKPNVAPSAVPAPEFVEPNDVTPSVVPAPAYDEPNGVPSAHEAPTFTEPAPEPAPGGNGGGGSGGGRSRRASQASFSTVATPGTGQVLGAENFLFLNNLRIGMQGNEVMELQKRLRAEGYFTFPTDTGYFGPITLASVKAYQQIHLGMFGNGYVTGFVGPLTRGILNGWLNFNWEA